MKAVLNNKFFENIVSKPVEVIDGFNVPLLTQETASCHGQLVFFVPLVEVSRIKETQTFNFDINYFLKRKSGAGLEIETHLPFKAYRFLKAALSGSLQDPIKNIIKKPT